MTNPHKIALRAANVAVITGLQDMLKTADFGTDTTSAAHLRWMCEELLDQLGHMPPDKSGRWIGFVQGVMAANGVLNVDDERNRTRPIYQKAYLS